MTSADVGSRAYILSRRGGGIGDLTTVTLESGDLAYEDCVREGVYKLNCKHQVGIATATEVGLPVSRFPIRVLLLGKADDYAEDKVTTCISYWRAINAAGEGITFARKPFDTDRGIASIYKYVQDLDEKLWNIFNGISGNAVPTVVTPEMNTALEALYNTLLVQSPTAEQIASIAVSYETIVNLFTAAHMYPRFKVADNTYLEAVPHGKTTVVAGTSSEDTSALDEFLLTAHLNRWKMKREYEALGEGVVTLAALSAAAVFRTGLYESHEHREYMTAVYIPVQGKASNYTFHSWRAPPGVAPRTDLQPPKTVDVSRIKLKSTMMQLANLMAVGSGLMHYLFNHTTGGMKVSGVLLSAMAMYKFITPQTTEEEVGSITSLLYEALHPTNKRAIANIFFKTSGVYSHGRSLNAFRYSRFELDSYMALRMNPYPAGSHKAFVLLTALRRILASGMGPFLPWAAELTACINTCAEVLKSGARAHIGSSYYTGEPPKAQPASLDNYLPEVAMFLHTFHKNDSLTMSPHMSYDIAKKANMNWQNLLKEMKSKDVSATSIDTVRQFLSTAGGAYFQFDPEDQSTWAGATATANVARQAIDNVFL